MDLEIEREALLGPLQSVMGVVERRQTLPILANVLLEASAETLRVTATDLEVELSAVAPADIQGEGAITVPARKLLDIIRNLGEGTRVRLHREGEQMAVRAPGSRFHLGTLGADDYPKVEDIGAVQSVRVPQESLRWLLEKTHFCMAVQDVRYFLNGLLLELEPERVRAVATDGHRLAAADLDAPEGLTEGKHVIVPRKGVQELMRLLERSSEPVKLELGQNHVRVELPGLRFISKLIEGRFPDYQGVIPEASGPRVEADREALRQALVRASILSNEKYRGVRWVLAHDGLRVVSNNPEQEEAEETVAAGYEGDALEIGFNAGYLLDAIGAIAEEQVWVYIRDANSSALIMGEDAGACRYVVMPMRL